MAQPVADGRSNGARVVLTLFVLAVVLSGIAFWRFTKSDRFISASQAQLQKRSARGWLWLAASAVFVQVLLGAMVRHSHSGRACNEDRVLCAGQLWPSWHKPSCTCCIVWWAWLSCCASPRMPCWSAPSPAPCPR